jgi:hypothetical protein
MKPARWRRKTLGAVGVGTDIEMRWSLADSLYMVFVTSSIQEDAGRARLMS